MSITTTLAATSQTVASNGPDGTVDAPSTLDDAIRYSLSFIATLRDGKGFTNPITLASAATTDIGLQNSFAVEISGTTTITSFGTNYNGPRFLRFTGALTLTQSASLNLPGGANITTVAGDTAIAYPNSALNGWNLTSYQNAVSSVMRSSLAGLTLSTAGASATMSIAAGQATDSANAVVMNTAATSKTTAAWAVGAGNGGLDTGAIANNSWYHFYLIRRPDTGVVDAIFSLSATAPTLPASYTQYRRIGAGRTNGTAQWTPFIQDGDLFQWLTSFADVSVVNPGTAAVLRTMTVPFGINVVALIQVSLINTGTAGTAFNLFSDPAITDVAPSTLLSDIAGPANVAGSNAYSAGRLQVRTSNVQNIRTRLSFSDVSVTLTINTTGWIDTRGKSL